MFLRNISPPSAGCKSKPRKKLAEAGSEQWRTSTGNRSMLPSCFSSNLKMVAIYPFETSVSLRTTWRYTPEHRHESLTCNVYLGISTASSDERIMSWKVWGRKRSWPNSRCYFDFVWRASHKRSRSANPLDRNLSRWEELVRITWDI
jgi:hypothetical protein